MVIKKNIPKDWLVDENLGKTINNYRTFYPFRFGTTNDPYFTTLYDTVFNEKNELDYIEYVDIFLNREGKVEVKSGKKNIKKYIDRDGIHLGNIVEDFIKYGFHGFKDTMLGTPARTYIETEYAGKKEDKKAA